MKTDIYYKYLFAIDVNRYRACNDTPVFMWQSQASGSDDGSCTCGRYLHFIQKVDVHCTHVPAWRTASYKFRCI